MTIETGMSFVGLVKTNMNPDFLSNGPSDRRNGSLGVYAGRGVGETLLGVGDIDCGRLGGDR